MKEICAQEQGWSSLTAIKCPCLTAEPEAGKEGQMQKAYLCIPVHPDLIWKPIKDIKGQTATLSLPVQSDRYLPELRKQYIASFY